MRLALLLVLVGLMILAKGGTHDAVAINWPSAANRRVSSKAALNRYFLTIWRNYNITSDGKRVVPTGPNPLHN
ncbi:hypothetical protein DITRI_Ditri10aG0190400 [Diplodiscus trichospermus]